MFDQQDRRDISAARNETAAYAIVEETAAAWARSFRAEDSIVRRRLSATLARAMDAALRRRISPVHLQADLDRAAETAIMAWFRHVACEGAAPDSRTFAHYRYAFLTANLDGRWSFALLDFGPPPAGLKQALEGATMFATPLPRPSGMPRQAF